uniref:GDP-fucose protein O-fucosyltransferase 2 n=1 Tax=Saccoglossus kowalevskii TaxID=10224 RepID=A0ABM0MWG6_SACKO|nr:PREDICTED: uncharacterized protein LOC100375788 [Saccoglossus kowalevskii]
MGLYIIMRYLRRVCSPLTVVVLVLVLPLLALIIIKTSNHAGQMLQQRYSSELEDGVHKLANAVKFSEGQHSEKIKGDWFINQRTSYKTGDTEAAILRQGKGDTGNYAERARSEIEPKDRLQVPGLEQFHEQLPVVNILENQIPITHNDDSQLPTINKPLTEPNSFGAQFPVVNNFDKRLPEVNTLDNQPEVNSFDRRLPELTQADTSSTQIEHVENPLPMVNNFNSPSPEMNRLDNRLPEANRFEQNLPDLTQPDTSSTQIEHVENPLPMVNNLNNERLLGLTKFGKPLTELENVNNQIRVVNNFDNNSPAVNTLDNTLSDVDKYGQQLKLNQFDKPLTQIENKLPVVNSIENRLPEVNSFAQQSPVLDRFDQSLPEKQRLGTPPTDASTITKPLPAAADLDQRLPEVNSFDQRSPELDQPDQRSAELDRFNQALSHAQQMDQGIHTQTEASTLHAHAPADEKTYTSNQKYIAPFHSYIDSGPDWAFSMFRIELRLALLQQRALVSVPFRVYSRTEDKLNMFAMKTLKETFDVKKLQEIVSIVSLDDFYGDCQNEFQPDPVLLWKPYYFVQDKNLSGYDRYIAMKKAFRDINARYPVTKSAKESSSLEDSQNFLSSISDKRCLALYLDQDIQWMKTAEDSKLNSLINQHLSFAPYIRELVDSVFEKICDGKPFVAVHWRNQTGERCAPGLYYNVAHCNAREYPAIFTLAKIAPRIVESLAQYISNREYKCIFIAYPPYSHRFVDHVGKLVQKVYSVEYIISASPRIAQHIHDSYMMSMIQQEIAVRADIFIGWSQSSWSSTVYNMREPKGGENVHFSDIPNMPTQIETVW